MKAGHHAEVCEPPLPPFADAAKQDKTRAALSQKLRKTTNNYVVIAPPSAKEEVCYRATELPSYRATELPSYRATERSGRPAPSRLEAPKAHSPRSLAWLLVIAFSGACLAAANLAKAQADSPDPNTLPSPSAYEWDYDGEEFSVEATDPDNWWHPSAPGTLPEEGSHLHFGNRRNLLEGEDSENAHLYPTWYDAEITSFGDDPMPDRFASLWFGFGGWNAELNYTLSGSQITVGDGSRSTYDRLIVAEGRGSHTLDLDVEIVDWVVPFRIHNGLARLRNKWDGSAEDTLTFSQSLTVGNGPLIVSGYGHTVINALHSSATGGTLIKEGTGFLEVDASGYEGEILIRGGALRGKRSDESSLTLAGGVYLLEDGETYEFNLYGSGSERVNWLEGESGGFGTAEEGGTAHLVFGSQGTTLTWGEGGFVSLGSELLFGSEWSSGSLYWHNALDLGDSLDYGGPRTIRLSRNVEAEETFTLYLPKTLTAASGQVLRLIGGGTVVVTADNYDFYGDLDIAGVDLVLRDGGSFFEAGHFTVRDGGSLTLSSYGAPPINNAAITLSSGTLNIESDWLSLGDLTLSGGANHIIRQPISPWVQPLPIQSLTRVAPRSTLLVSLLANDSVGNSILQFTEDTANAITAAAIGGITPWIVTTTGADDSTRRADWAVIDDSKLRRARDNDYYTGSESTWSAEANVNVGASAWGTPPTMLSSNRTINSLRLAAGASIDLNGKTLTIASGGLLIDYSRQTALILGGPSSSALTTAAGRPLYVHTHGDGFISARITGGMDLVKAGSATLTLYSHAPNGHDNALGSLYIHEGRFELNNGARIHATGPIYVGDGGHSATLSLEASDNRWGPPLISGAREVRLRGGHDFSKTASLELLGSHNLHLDHLSISGSSVLEFAIANPWGTVSKIYSELFTIEGKSSRLHVRGWGQRKGNSGTEVETGDYFTHILVSKSSPLLDDYLSQIWFEDYGDAVKIDWKEDTRYWEIVPGWRGWGDINPGGGGGGGGGGDCPPDYPDCPEPSTYGAILAAAGIGLVLWRRRKHQGKRSDADMLPPSTGAIS